MDIVLIIPCHNEVSVIGETIDIARRNSRGKFREIVVVDNASTDETAEVASAHGARVVFQPQKGLPAARQAGFEATSGDLVAYIDADTHITERWIDIAEQTFNDRPDIVSLSGPRRYFGASRFQIWVLNAMWATAPLAYPLVGYMILGGNFIVKRTALEKIGGFDQSIQFYGEDTNIARRLSKVGKVLFRMDFYVYASARRFQQEGIIKTNLVYAVNFIWQAVFKRPFTTASNDVR